MNAELRTFHHDAVIDTLGADLLRELKAIAWFCDAMPDGKYAVFGSDRLNMYQIGGKLFPLVEHGCLRLLRKTWCEVHQKYRPALKVEQFGRNILLRCDALQIDLETLPDDGDVE